MDNVTLGLAFIAGFLSFVSPCVLPLVPAYIGYMSGRMTRTVAVQTAAVAGSDKRKITDVTMRANMGLHGVAFVAGFALVFILIGIATTAFVGVLGSAVSTITLIIGRLGGILIIIFGLHFMGALQATFKWLKKNPHILKSPIFTLAFGLVVSAILSWGLMWTWLVIAPLLLGLWIWLLLGGGLTHPQAFWMHIIETIEATLYADTRQDMQQSGRSGLPGSFMMGVVFSAGWTPCIGPLLGTILTLAANTGDVGQAVPLLAAYSLGLGIPFIIAAVLMDSAQGLLRRLQRHMRTIELVSGGLLVIIGVAVASGQLTTLSQNLSNQFADFSFRVEECGLGFFEGDLQFNQVGACVGGTLVPVAVNQGTRVVLDANTTRMQYVFHVDDAQDIDVEITQTDDAPPLQLTLLTADGKTITSSDEIRAFGDDSDYVALAGTMLPGAGQYTLVIEHLAPDTLQPPADAENILDYRETFRLKVVQSDPEREIQLEESVVSELARVAAASSDTTSDANATGGTDTSDANNDNVADALGGDGLNTIEALAAASDAPDTGPEVGLDVGNLAPDFTVRTINGQSVTLSELRGQVVLLNFWGTWCGPCRREMPEFQDAYEQYKDDGFTILALAVRDRLDAVYEFRSEFGLTFPIAMDEGNQITDLYGVVSQPSTYIIDEAGIIRHRVFGLVLPEQLQEMVHDVLPQTADTTADDNS